MGSARAGQRSEGRRVAHWTAQIVTGPIKPEGCSGSSFVWNRWVVNVNRWLGRPVVAAEAFTAPDREAWKLHPGALKYQ